MEEKGKTEQNNVVIGVLDEYEPKNRKIFTQLHLLPQVPQELGVVGGSSTAGIVNNTTSTQPDVTQSTSHSNVDPASNVVVVTYDDLKNTLDVFLQVLLSQHLNAEFLVRIKEIQDEYFRPSIEFIDTILNDKYSFLLNNFSQFMNLGKKVIDNKFVEYQLDPVFKYLLDTRPKFIAHQANLLNHCRCQVRSITFFKLNL